jgi:hypothetical protein
MVYNSTEILTMACNSMELLYALYYIYIGDKSPIEFMAILKQFITMLRIQSPPYSSDSITSLLQYPEQGVYEISRVLCMSMRGVMGYE